jgi:hypothetical protein
VKLTNLLGARLMAKNEMSEITRWQPNFFISIHLGEVLSISSRVHGHDKFNIIP